MTPRGRDHLFSFIDADDRSSIGASDTIGNLTPHSFLDVDSTRRGKATKSFLSLDSPASAVSSPISHGFHKNGTELCLSFASAAELLEHVTRNWRKDFVTQDLRTEHAIQMFIKRPFFMLLSIDGPISDRFRRANKFVLCILYKRFASRSSSLKRSGRSLSRGFHNSQRRRRLRSEERLSSSDRLD